MTKVDRALEIQVIDWLQWGKFSEENNLPGLALELISKRKADLDLALKVLNYPNTRPPMPTINSNGQMDDALAFLDEWLTLTHAALNKITTGSEPERK